MSILVAVAIIIANCVYDHIQVEFYGGMTTSLRCVDLVRSYLNSEQYKSLQSNLTPILEQANREKERNKLGQVGKRLKSRHHLYATSFLWQVYL